MSKFTNCDSLRMKKITIVISVLSLILFCSTVKAEDDLPAIGLTPPPPPSELPAEMISESASEPAPEVVVKKETSLTDNIKDNAEALGKADDAIIDVSPSVGDNLVDKIANIEKGGIKAAKSAGETLSEMINSKKEESKQEVQKAMAVKRSNASVFDISGAMLRMNPAQIEAALTRRGYKKTVEKQDIPNFIRWRNEEKCRAQGVVGYERLASCVTQMAKKDNHQFIERVFYSKYDTQEDMEIRFTSNFTKNKAYYLFYKSNVLTNIRGNSQKEFYLRNIKVYDFWKRINQKYGVPDNKENVIWGLGGNKPYLQAGTGKLRLEDPTLRDLDYTRMSREDRRFMNTGLYNF